MAIWYDNSDGYLIKVVGNKRYGCSPLGEVIDDDGEVVVQKGILYSRLATNWRFWTTQNNWQPAIEDNGKLSPNSPTHKPQIGSDDSFLKHRQLAAIANERGAHQYRKGFNGTPEDFEDMLDDLDVY